MSSRKQLRATMTTFRLQSTVGIRFARNRLPRDTIMLDTKTADVNGQRVHLTAKEYQMLELLSLRKGATVTMEMFLNYLYGGMDEPEVKIIDVFICKLRKKLATATGGKHYIETIWGRGYVLRNSEDASEVAV